MFSLIPQIPRYDFYMRPIPGVASFSVGWRVFPRQRVLRCHFSKVFPHKLTACSDRKFPWRSGTRMHLKEPGEISSAKPLRRFHRGGFAFRLTTFRGGQILGGFAE